MSWRWPQCWERWLRRCQSGWASSPETHFLVPESCPLSGHSRAHWTRSWFCQSQTTWLHWRPMPNCRSSGQCWHVLTKIAHLLNGNYGNLFCTNINIWTHLIEVNSWIKQKLKFKVNKVMADLLGIEVDIFGDGPFLRSLHFQLKTLTKIIWSI